jgi:hypothetical protein
MMVVARRREQAALQNLPNEAFAPYDGSLSAHSATFNLDLGKSLAKATRLAKRTSTFLSSGNATAIENGSSKVKQKLTF